MANEGLIKTSVKLLNNRVAMPSLGLGVYKMAQGQETEQAVQWALAAGYRHIDTASLYGNEKEVGNAVRTSGIPRDGIFITTKLWPTNFLWAESAFKMSLKNLGLEYIDLYLIHWPVVGKNRAWKILEKIYAQKLVKAIGVSNYSIQDLESLLKFAKVIPAVNQVEFSPFSYKKELLDYCQSKGIVVEAYSPLTRGKRLNNSVIVAAAKKYGKTSAQIMLRWSIQHELIVIPKSSKKERIIENSQIFDFQIDEQDMATLNSLNENYFSRLS